MSEQGKDAERLASENDRFSGGAEGVWVPDEDWRAEGEGRRCRQSRCPNVAVAKLKRSNGWYHYCADHLYGRRVADGQVWVNVHPDSPAARRYAALAHTDQGAR